LELLAPAGNWQALVAAIENGANAVYLGGPVFNARHSAENFTIEMIKQAVEYAHLREKMTRPYIRRVCPPYHSNEYRFPSGFAKPEIFQGDGSARSWTREYIPNQPAPDRWYPQWSHEYRYSSRLRLPPSEDNHPLPDQLEWN
jgi:hypothetical protein